ncbi:hypothetical protein UlMin_006048 [Ulmus minor]
MRRLSTIVRNGQKALQDLNLLKVLQSEISYELSAKPFQDVGGGSLGDFTVDWDSLQSQDVVLRRKCETGEVVVVSALLGPLVFEKEAEESLFPRNVLMKVCVKKPGLRSLMQFDCQVSEKGTGGSEFDIHNAYFLQSSAVPSRSAYTGSIFRYLDSQLQDAFKDYLVAKGIGENLTNFLLLHLHKKEHGQYVNWLRKLESSVAKSE